jgi:hypothetical protein
MQRRKLLVLGFLVATCLVAGKSMFKETSSAVAFAVLCMQWGLPSLLSHTHAETCKSCLIAITKLTINCSTDPAGVAAAKDDSADLSSTPKVADEAAQKTGTDAAAAER